MFASYSDKLAKVKTKALRTLLETDPRIVGFAIEPDGVFLYTNSSEWCDDAGAGTWREDTESAVVRAFKATVRKAGE